MTVRTRWWLVLALAGVFALKLVVLASLGSHPLLEPVGELDGAYYRFLAERVAGGDVWLTEPGSFFGRPAPAFFLSPLYIYFLALIFKLGGSIDTARFVQIALGTAAVALIWLTARRWYGPTAAWAAGALAAACGLFTFYEILILQAALDPFLAALDLFLLARAAQGRRWRRWAAAGAAIGLHVLNRPNLLVVLLGLSALVVASAALARWRTGRSGAVSTARPAAYGLALAAAGLLAVAPVTVRNWVVSGELVLVSSHGGFNFFVGNGPGATGTYRYVLDLEPSITGQWTGAVDTVRREIGHDPSAADVSDYFYAQTWNWVREHPRAELVLLLRKTWYAVSAAFVTLNHSFPFFVHDVDGPLAWLAIGPWLLVPLGLIGLVVARPRDGFDYWLWAAYVPLAFMSLVIFFVAARYRIPYQIGLTVAAGGGLAWLIERWRTAPVSTRLATAAAFVLLLAIVNWPTGLDDGRAEEQVRMGLREIEAGRGSIGESWIARALIQHPFPGAVHVRVGQAYEVRNQFTDALRHYDAALEIDPDEPSVSFVRGRALYYAGRLSEARDALERARTGPQRDAAARLLVLTAVRDGDDRAADRLAADLRPEEWTADQARQYAEALVSLGRADLSIVAWTRAAESSGWAEDSERLGLALAVSGRAAEAVEAFREGVSRNGRSASLRLNLAVMLAETGAVEDAKKEAAEALRLDPNYDRAKALLAALSGK